MYGQYKLIAITVQSLSGGQLFVTPWIAVCQASVSYTITQSLLSLMFIQLVMPSNHLTYCRPLLLWTSVFPSPRIFFNESVLHIRWPNYWSFSFSISPSNEYSGLSSLRMDYLNSLQSKVSQESSPTPQLKSINPLALTLLYGPSSWQIDGATMETVRDLILGDLKITADCDCSHEIKRLLLLGRKTMTNLVSILKSRDITLPTRVHLIKAMVFPIVMCGCESWTIKKAEGQRTDASELWYWRRLLRVPWTARRSNQSILKEISPVCSLEGLILKLKFQ